MAIPQPRFSLKPRPQVKENQKKHISSQGKRETGEREGLNLWKNKRIPKLEIGEQRKRKNLGAIDIRVAMGQPEYRGR
ncbi:uncharacterized protein G2W53_004430 [Senna tora]|uniref:Uncharacterized protein n=1 Tax=Senna tora TaxID=362788 RepID=A0A835CK70_9FABA|nr:uncharacterized protein G2W53_004430 [Senna tora]